MKALIPGSLLLLLAACVKDKPQPLQPPPVQVTGQGSKVYVTCEGTFGASNADLSFFDPASGSSVDRYYRQQNGKSPGDVLQSMSKLDNQYYLVVNNSSKIIVTDAQMRYQREVKGLLSPRFMLRTSPGKAYVSDLKANALSVLDLNAATVTGKIPLSGWTEHMVQLYHKVFVTNIRRPYLYIVDASKDIVTDSIPAAVNASGLVLDNKDRIWLLTSGDEQLDLLPALFCFDASSHAVLQHFVFKAGDGPSALTVSAGRDTLYFLNDHVYRMSVEDNQLPGQFFLTGVDRNYYGLGINPRDRRVYVSDAMNYIERSTTYVYSPGGSLEYSFKSWINANGFYFE